MHGFGGMWGIFFTGGSVRKSIAVYTYVHTYTQYAHTLCTQLHYIYTLRLRGHVGHSLHICIYAYTYMYTYVHIYTYMHTHMCAHTYTHTHAQACWPSRRMCSRHTAQPTTAGISTACSMGVAGGCWRARSVSWHRLSYKAMIASLHHKLSYKTMIASLHHNISYNIIIDYPQASCQVSQLLGWHKLCVICGGVACEPTKRVNTQTHWLCSNVGLKNPQILKSVRYFVAPRSLASWPSLRGSVASPHLSSYS